MNPVRFRPMTRVSRILCIPLFVVFLLLANGASVSANAATDHAVKPNFPTYTPCTPPTNPGYCVPGDGQISVGSDVVAGGTIAADPNTPSSLVAGGIDKSCSGGPENAVFYSSTTGGTAWSTSPYCMPLVNSATNGGTPAAAFDLNHDSYIATVESGTIPDGTDIVVESSLNGACSPPAPWCTPVTIAPYLSGASITGNQINMQIDHASISYKNCIYVAARQLTASSAAITVSYLCPPYTWGSNAFTTKVVTTVNYPGTAVVSPSLTIGSNGNVYATWLQCNPVAGHCDQGTANTLWISESTNDGVTWSSPRIITKVVLVPNNCSHSLGCIPGTGDELSDEPSVGIDSTNKLYVAYYTYVRNRLQVKVSSATSINGPWSSVRVDPGDTNDEFLPWLSVNPVTGTVGVTWLELYTSGSNAGKYQEYGALKKLGNFPWVEPTSSLASALSNPNNTWGSDSYIGDYMDNVWAQTGTSPTYYTLFSVWTDTRTAQDELAVGGISSLY